MSDTDSVVCLAGAEMLVFQYLIETEKVPSDERLDDKKGECAGLSNEGASSYARTNATKQCYCELLRENKFNKLAHEAARFIVTSFTTKVSGLFTSDELSKAREDAREKYQNDIKNFPAVACN